MKHLTEEQRQERKARLRDIVKKVSAMTPEEKAHFAEKILITTCEGHTLSYYNNCLICAQGGGHCTLVGGFKQWLKQGRAVQKGQHGYTIFFPRTVNNGNGNEEAPEEESELRFYTTTVFDISQTIEIESN